MKTVIILAAGVGSRLRPLTSELPKSLVPVNGIPLLDRFLRQVENSSEDLKIVVVAGYLSEKVIDLVSDFKLSFNSDIKVIVNDDYETTNNMESCRLALEHEDYEDCIIVNADCIYDDEIVLDMIDRNYSCIATDSSKYYEENMKVLTSNNSIHEISKNLANHDGVTTAIDLYHFVKRDIDTLLKIMQSFYQKGDLLKWNEVAINELVKVTPVKAVDYSGKRWMEIDDLADLNYAEKLFS